ncbi:MAG: VOC family protein [Nitrospinaceae bacterium]|nr:VOC family protein [Nitrospinaceae bacterium]NIR56762.1 VOC family protein [Nitrospinaceae bacterium]NIS87213.1 VOC family protein [Nitrospinaceae bacterium]NIT84083.1 VOC family protein [Nitrospinaceae bacterium]NIU46262.1 VOC family protein [Nitrospinaceae bacterium]
MIRKYLHTRFRVSDMEKSIRFYTEVLGFKLLERKTSPRGSQLAFLQAPGTDSELELCSFPESGQVEVPEDLVHLAFQVDNLEESMDRLKQANVPITEGPVETSSGTRFLFTEDPDRYEIELMEYPDS